MNDLLKPRFEVIADYPDNEWDVGDIIDKDWAHTGADDITVLWKISDFPHLFRKLNWWEKREESEMPIYLKFILRDETSYYKIQKWDMVNMLGVLNNRQCCDLLGWNQEYTYQPSTEQEYNDNTNHNGK